MLLLDILLTEGETISALNFVASLHFDFNSVFADASGRGPTLTLEYAQLLVSIELAPAKAFSSPEYCWA